MITVYFTNINNLDDGVFNRLLARADAAVREKILAYRSREEQKRRLCGKLLFNKLLDHFHLGQQFSVRDLEYNEYGKPSFSIDVDFNIAHSGDMVICVGIRSAKIGVDVEKKENKDVNEMREYFTAGEWDIIIKEHVFYEMWVRKESCLKAIGKGLYLPLNEIDVSKDEVVADGSKWFLHDVDISEGYAVCIATNMQNAGISIAEVTINKLVNEQ